MFKTLHTWLRLCKGRGFQSEEVRHTRQIITRKGRIPKAPVFFQKELPIFVKTYIPHENRISYHSLRPDADDGMPLRPSCSTCHPVTCPRRWRHRPIQSPDAGGSGPGSPYRLCSLRPLTFREKEPAARPGVGKRGLQQFPVGTHAVHQRDCMSSPQVIFR